MNKGRILQDLLASEGFERRHAGSRYLFSILQYYEPGCTLSGENGLYGVIDRGIDWRSVPKAIKYAARNTIYAKVAPARIIATLSDKYEQLKEESQNAE